MHKFSAAFALEFAQDKVPGPMGHSTLVGKSVRRKEFSPHWSFCSSGNAIVVGSNRKGDIPATPLQIGSQGEFCVESTFGVLPNILCVTGRWSAP